MLLFSTVLGFTLYKDTGDGRGATHQIYSPAKQIWYTPLVLYMYRAVQPAAVQSAAVQYTKLECSTGVTLH